MKGLMSCLHSSRRSIGKAVFTCICLIVRVEAQAQLQYVPSINTIAGTGTSGYTGDGGPGIVAKVANGMRQVAVDNQGNVYLTDTTNNVIRRVDARTGVITTVVGNGTACASTTSACGDGAAATLAQLNNARGIAVDGSGNIYLADYNDHRIRVVSAATGKISTLVGTGNVCSPAGGTCGDGGQAKAAALRNPSAVALDTSGNLYVADEFDYKIRKVVLKTGGISTVAGTGTAGFSGDGGAATSAQINAVTGIACDAAGNLYIADNTNYRVRMVLASNGYISTIAGTGTAGTTGNGGPASSALLGSPYNLAVDANGNVYVADNTANQIREILATAKGAAPTFGNIVLFAGGGTSFADGGLPTKTTLNGLNGVAADPFGNVIIGDTNNARIRKVSFTIPLAATSVGATTSTPTKFIAQTSTADTLATANFPTGFTEFSVGTLSGCTLGGVTLAGTICGIPLNFTPAYPGLRSAPFQLKDNIGNDFTLGVIGYGMAPAIAITPGTISTVAGNGAATYSGDGGAALLAALSGPASAIVDTANNIYIADAGNHVVRRIDGATGKITTFAGTGGVSGYGGDNGAATGAKLNAPQGITLDVAGNLYIADTGNHAIREVSAQTGNIVTIAGGNGNGYSGDGGTAIGAKLSSPSGVAFDPNGSLYVADTGNNVIRQVNMATGTIATIAGTGTAGNTGDGAAPAGAELNGPTGIFLEASGLLLLATPAANTVRQINLNTGIITTVAGTGTSGYTGDGGLATAASLKSPMTVAADAAGNTYIADTGNAVIRRIDAATGDITTIAGTGNMGYSGDNGAATAAALNAPTGIALDSADNFYISDTAANVLRRIGVGSTRVDFGNQGIFASSPVKRLTLTNTGNQTLTLTGLSITGNFQQKFSGSNDCTGTIALAAGASCNISLTFEPLSVTTYSGTIVVTDNALNGSNASQTIQLAGAGVASTNAILSAVSGDNQAVKIGTALAIPPQVRLTDASGTPLLGQSLIFSAPASGATGIFPGGLDSVTVMTDSTGTAMAPAFTANNTTGGYSMMANFASAAKPVLFSLNNVLNQYATATALTVTPTGSSPVYGQAVTLTAVISPQSQNGNSVTGLVLFYDGSAILASVASTNATASYTAIVPSVGNHNYKAVYAGDLNFAPSTSLLDAVGVTQSPVSISPTSASVYLGQTTTTIILAGTIAGNGILPPTGNVSYTIGTNPPSSSTIINGQAVLTISSTLAVGSYTITAIYPGDANYSPGSGTISLSILQPSFTLSASPTSLTVAQGSYSSTNLTVTPLGNLPGTVTFSCSGLPRYSACVFNTTAVSAGNPVNTLTFNGSNTAQTVQLSIAEQDVANSLDRPRQLGRSARLEIILASVFPGILFVCGIGVRARRLASQVHPFWLCMLVFALASIMGCGSTSNRAAPAPFLGSTTITVTATDNMNSAVQTLTISLTVQP